MTSQPDQVQQRPVGRTERPAGRGASCDAIIVAAGRGERLGLDVPKALVSLGDATVLEWAVRSLAAAGLVDPVVVVPAGHEDDFSEVTTRLGITRMVAGGDQRHDSVRAGLDAARDTDLVAVHDAARPLVPATVVNAAVGALDAEDVIAAAPALPVADTLKRAVDGTIHTVDRTGLQAVQTPQVFRAPVLRSLLAGSDPTVTDELLVVEAAIADRRASGRIVLVPGSLRAMKITRLEDLDVLRDLVRSMDR